MTTNRRNPRYKVEEVSKNEVVVTFYVEDQDGNERLVQETWWAPANGGYVRQTTERRPGTLGQQLYDHRSSVRGSTWYWSGGYALVDAARSQLRALFRQQPDYCELLSLTELSYYEDNVRCAGER